MADWLNASDYTLIRLIFERSLSGLYFIAFLSAFNQFPALLGERGLLPVPDFIKQITFKISPSIFHYFYSDKVLRIFCFIGMLLSAAMSLGLYSQAPIIVHMFTWLLMYAIYLSIVNVGQDFYGFGWETMLLEAGFFAAFMGPEWVTPSWIPILILRWMLFRTELGAGLIKIRGDDCWKDLTCLYYHHETQPLPNPLSRFFHHQPKWFHRAGVVFSHFVQLIVPFGLFLPQPVAGAAGFLIILHQMILVISGNYSWLNWLTIVLGVLAFADPASTEISITNRPLWFEIIQWGVGGLALYLSYQPLLNLFSPRQKMNYCWNRWHLVGAYGAFGSVTKERYEIVIEGTADAYAKPESEWKEYKFKGKPVALDKLPPVVAPYHLRLDWMIWFLPFTVHVSNERIYVRGHELWFVRLIKKLLVNDSQLLKLFKDNPFKDSPPRILRARFYRYEFTTREEFKSQHHVWKRKLLGEYFPQLSLEDFKSLSGL